MDGDGSPQHRASRGTDAFPDIRLSTALERRIWRSGETIGGLLRLTNTSATDTVRLETGSPTTGVLLDADGAHVGGGYVGWIAGVGRFIQLTPGDEDTVDFLAQSDAVGGTALPPGAYFLSVRLRVSSDSGDHLLIAPPAPIRLERA